MTEGEYRHRHVIRTVDLGAPAAAVWDVIGGFYTIHDWHPDIESTEVPPRQTETRELRRLLTFPGQPKTTEPMGVSRRTRPNATVSTTVLPEPRPTAHAATDDPNPPSACVLSIAHRSPQSTPLLAAGSSPHR